MERNAFETDRGTATRRISLPIVILSLALLATSGCVMVQEGSGVPHTEHRSAGEFDRVRVVGAFDAVEITVCGCDTEIAISGDDNIVEDVQTEVVGGELEISSTETWDYDLPLVAEIRVPSLEAVELAGQATIDVRRLDSERFTVDSTGSGTIVLAGRAGLVEINMSASSEVRAFDLEAETVKFRSSGSADVSVCATGVLDVETSGSGDLIYDCEPEHVLVDASGSGRVRSR